MDLQAVYERIDREEVAELALSLAQIDSATTQELPVAEFLEEWLRRNGFEPRRVSLVPERPNVMAVLKGSGGGKSLLFNAHMDTAVWDTDPRFLNPRDPIFHTGWREGDTIHGYGAVNDKGPMAPYLIAVRALRDAGVELRGDVIVSAASGECGHEPVDEFQGLHYSGKDLGARYLAQHGGVADYVLVAEATDFRVAWVEAGKVHVKVRLIGGRSTYSPYAAQKNSPSALPQAAQFILAWEEWIGNYTERHRYECEGGTVTPNGVIAAIRAGIPYAITRTPQVVDIYIDLRLSPGQSPTETIREVERLVESLNLKGEVTAYLFRPGFEAKGIEPLVEAIRVGHRRVFGTDSLPPTEQMTSMWRDNNAFNELGIPSAIYAPGKGSGTGTYGIEVEDLYKAALVYANVAVEICA